MARWTNLVPAIGQARSYRAGVAGQGHRRRSRDHRAVGTGRHGVRRGGRPAAGDRALRDHRPAVRLRDLRAVANHGARPRLVAHAAPRCRDPAARRRRLERGGRDRRRMLAILAGVMCIVAGLARFGFISELLSAPVRYGYLHGIAVTIIVAQAAKLCGFSVQGESLFSQLRQLVDGLNDGRVQRMGTRRRSRFGGTDRRAPLGIRRRSRQPSSWWSSASPSH